MTRINTIDPSFLTDQHLFAEYRELPRIFTLVREGKAKGTPCPKYTMGTGHVTFFYDKLNYLFNRYKWIIEELESRGYNLNPVPLDDLANSGTEDNWSNDWIPNFEDFKVNCVRLLEKLEKQKLTFRKTQSGVIQLKSFYQLMVSGAT